MIYSNPGLYLIKLGAKLHSLHHFNAELATGIGFLFQSSPYNFGPPSLKYLGRTQYFFNFAFEQGRKFISFRIEQVQSVKESVAHPQGKFRDIFSSPRNTYMGLILGLGT